MSTHRQAVEGAVVTLLDGSHATLFGRAWDLSQPESRDQCVEWCTELIVDAERLLFADEGNQRRALTEAQRAGLVDDDVEIEEFPAALGMCGWWRALATLIRP